MSHSELPAFEQYNNQSLYSDLPLSRKSLSPEYRKSILANERGEMSVRNVCQAIGSLNNITDIIVTEANSYEDSVEKKDVIVYLHKNYDGIEEIGIQVKSSLRGILKFLRHFDSEDSSKAWEKIFQQRLALLNGQLKNHIIIGNFNYQLEKIVEYSKAS